MEALSQNPQFSSATETKGFDLSAGQTWIYPENYPVRDYQYNIVQTALFNNTLVCLPTGLGKTFIAAVVMYNFWRWYPCGKIIFLAPTKPLVAQQIYACCNIMGIPNTEITELTGAINKKQREVSWLKKRVIFATPQVFHNDLESSKVPSTLVKCVVIDEAHKALGKHSYCECIKILSTRNEYFRVLALSATPGNKIDNVHEILKNLHISHLELRDETSIDIMPYINQRKVEIILVPLSQELANFKERYVFIMDRHVKLLIQCNVLRGHTANISKGRIFHVLKEFQKKTNKSGNYGQIIKTLNILLTMYHAYELLIRHGLRAFHTFYNNHSDKFWMNEESQLQNLLGDIQSYLGPFPDIQPLIDGSLPEIPENLVFGHNKFHKLKELLLKHFETNNENRNDTRAMVFVEYRDIVNEIYILLLQSRPLIRPQIFVGQAGQKQKQQIKALDNFRKNHVNVLISTSIGEEGLDVGEVDLIICFDISQQSPTRLVQRMGRTGRRRDGHIIVLVTDGKEHETLKSTMARRDSLNNKILNTSNIFSSLYENNPRMIPSEFTPECHKMYINVEITADAKGKGKKKKTENQTVIKDKIGMQVSATKDSTQSSIANFLKDTAKHTDEDSNACNTVTLAITQGNNVIKPSNVKLLSSDNEAVDFLTLCTIRKSEKELCSNTTKSIYMKYADIPSRSSTFDFTMPNLKILDCLSSLNYCTVKITSPTNESKICSESDIQFACDNNCDDTQVNTSIKNESSGEEIKFEDLLDESSDSSEVICTRVRSSVKLKENTSKRLSENLNTTVNVTETEESTLNDPKPGVFENILDDSSDSIEIVKSEHFEDTYFESKECNEDVVIVPDKIKKLELSETEPALNETMLSVTQAIKEVAHINSRVKGLTKSTEESVEHGVCTQENISEKSSTISVPRLINDTGTPGLLSEDDMFDTDPFEDSEFNFDAITLLHDDVVKKSFSESKSPSVFNRSLHIEKLKKANYSRIADSPKSHSNFKEDTPSRISKKLSEVRKRSLLNSFEENPNQKKEDSEDDFVINVSAAEKLNELESSYFCQTSNRTNVNVASTSKNTGPIALSLKRNKIQEASPVTLNSFKAPDKYDRSNIDSPRGADDSPLNKNLYRKNSGKEKKKRKKKVKNDFILDEAEVSVDETSDESSGLDEDLADFVSYSQNILDTSDMRAHYLQTIKSPLNHRGNFVFKNRRIPKPDLELYFPPISQILQDTYLQDSFCVGANEDEDISNQSDEYSYLENIEMELENRKRKRGFPDTKRVKRKRKLTKVNQLNTSTSSEDDTELLRKQIQDESILLKQNQ